MSINTLVVLGSTLTALAVVRVAKRSGMYCVILDDTAGPAAVSRMAEFRRLASADANAIRASASDLMGRSGVAVIADCDRWLRFIRDNRPSLAAAGWEILHPQAQALKICLDKTAFLVWCHEHGFDAPRPYPEATVAQLAADAYPLMIRPEWTQHSTPTGLPKAIEVRKPTELRYWLDRYAATRVAPSICESLISENLVQFSVGAARNTAGEVLTFLAEKVRPRAEQCGGGTFVRPATHIPAEQLAVRVLNALDFFGIAEVEILYDSVTRRMSLIEVNARPWLQYGLPYACGCDLLAHALGSQREKRERNSGHAWIHFVPDLRVCFSPTGGLVRAGRVTLSAYILDVLHADVHALFDWRDPMPILREVWRTSWS